jgi:hypothetical protein
MDTERWDKYVDLVYGMAFDTKIGKGPTREAFVANLKVTASKMEDILIEEQYPDLKQKRG